LFIQRILWLNENLISFRGIVSNTRLVVNESRKNFANLKENAKQQREMLAEERAALGKRQRGMHRIESPKLKC